VPVLAGLLTDPEHNQRAATLLRIAMKTKGDQEQALASIRKAMKGVGAAAKVPLINALALEKDAASLADFARFANSADPTLGGVGILALGELGADGVGELRKLKKTGAVQQKVDDALFRATETALKAGNTKLATTVYLERLGASYSMKTRIGALRGLVQSDAKQVQSKLQAFIKTGPTDLRQGAFMAAIALQGGAGDKLLAGVDPAGLSPDEQTVLVTALRDRGGDAMRARLRQLTAMTDTAVSTAASGALADIGDAADVKALVGALSRDDAAKDAAATALAKLGADGVDEALVGAAQTAPAPVQAALAEVLGDRRTPAAAKLLMKLRNHENSDVSKEAWKSLTYCATAAELPELIASLAAVEGRTGSRTSKVLVAIGDRMNDTDAVAAALINGLPKANLDGKKVVVGCLASFQNAASLKTLRAGLSDKAPEMRYESLKALSKWQTAEPLDDLFKLAESADDKSRHILALRGYADVLKAVNGTVPKKVLIAHYQRGFKIAAHPQELTPLLSALAESANRAGLPIAAAYLTHADANVHAAAWQALTALNGGGVGTKAASHRPEYLKYLNDGKPETRWTSGTPMRPGMWFSVNLGEVTQVTSVALDNDNPKGESRNDYTRDPKLFMSADGEDWQPVAAAVKKVGNVIAFTCDIETQHVKVVNGGATAGSYWSVHEFRINDSDAGRTKPPVEIKAEALKVTA
jgi:hypothetical protein